MKRTKHIVIYNHKGGVGKTTLTVNIAAALAGMGKRVLCIDSDPQCNLTSYFLEESVVNDLLDKSESSDGRTIWSAIEPVVKSRHEFNTIEPYEMPVKNLYLIPGDIKLSIYEEDLPEAWLDCYRRKEHGFMRVMAISHLVREIEERFNLEYIFYDAGPNIGALNRTIFLDCDYFIVPAACDIFSIRALSTLGHITVKWINEWAVISTLAPEGIRMYKGRPKFLGYIPQRFKIYLGQPARSFMIAMSAIEREVLSQVVSRLREIDEKLVVGKIKDFKLGQVKDFGSLAIDAQKSGKPFWTADGKNPKLRDQARETFLYIANRIIERDKEISDEQAKS